MITYFKHKNNKSKTRYKKNQTLTTVLKSFDTFVITVTTSSSVILSLIGVGLIAIPIAIASACSLSIGNKILYEIIIKKTIITKKQYEKDQQTTKSFDK